MPKIGQQGIAHLLLIVLLLAGVGLGVYLIGQRTNIFPWASSNPISSPCPVSGPCPSSGVADSDSDGFSNLAEAFMGTNPNLACGVDTWPVDVNNDMGVNGGDVSLLIPYIDGTNAYNKRYDLNQDGAITQTGDVPVIQQYFLQICTPATAGSAFYSLSVPSNVGLNENFKVKIRVKTPTESANTFLAQLQFDNSKLEVVDIKMDDSVGSFITQTDDIFYDNATGEISLLGGLPDPGLTTVLAAGETMAEITFNTKATGQSEITLLSTSEIISNNSAINILNVGSFLGYIVNVNVPFSPSPSPSVAPSVSPSPSPAQACIITAVGWVSNTNPIQNGSLVTLRVTGSGDCEGQTLAFTVGEDDGLIGSDPVVANPVNATFNNSNIATTSWVAEFQQDGFNGFNNPPEYFFTASLTGNPQTTLTTTAGQNLRVNNLREGEFINGDGNRDGKVDIRDLAVLRKWWGKTGFPQEIDIDDNGVLNTFDLGGLRKILEAAGIIKTTVQ